MPAAVLLQSCRSAIQPPVLQCRLSRSAGGNHISFLYKVFMFCWWCTATELASRRDQDIQGPLQHFYCQDCCDNYITGGDNLETSFPSALKLVAVFPFGSLGIGGRVGWKHTTMYWCAAVTSESVLNVSAERVITADAFTCKYTSNYIYMCDVDAHFACFCIHTYRRGKIYLHTLTKNK